MKEHFSNAANTKEGSDGQKMKKIEADCDTDFRQSEQFSKFILFACNILYRETHLVVMKLLYFI